MTSSGEPLIELSEAETPGQAAVAFLECLKADCSVAQSLVYVLDRETGELQLYASSKDASISPRDSAQQLDSTALESVETGEDRHVYVEEIAAESPFRQLLDLDNAEPLSVLKCCPVRGRKQKGRVVALFVMLCHHPPEGSGGPETALAPLSTLKGLLAVAVERTEALSRHRKDLAVVRENSETEVALWNDFYHLFSYRHDSMVLTQELCRMAENLTRGASSIFLVNENGGTLFCQLRNLKVPREDIILPIESSPYGDVVEADSTCIVENLDRYPQEVLLLSEDGKRPTSMMCAAISAKYEDGHGEKVAVMAIASYDTHCFSEKDLKIFMWLVNHATPLYLGVLLNDSVTLTKLQNDSLLQVAGHLFAHLDDMSRLLKEILSHARHLINAERCSLFLLEKNEKNVEELVAVIFDNEIVGEGPRRISLSHSIAGQVASAGELKNVSDVHDESDFCKDVDAATGFKTRNLLCFPIKGKNGSVLGVAQLVNKIGGGNFSYIDEELAKSFAVYCGISICHSLLYTRAKEAQNRSRLATELMIYHMQTNEDDVAALARMPSQIPETARRAIGSFEFSHKGYPDLENMQLLVGMFDEMGLINRWRIPKVILCRFLLTVKRGYRHPPYHNWDHAFAVAHFCYCLWRRCGHLQPLSDMEVLGLFVASLCHDIDHRGTNNAFQVNAHSVLAALYSSEGSVMEHHHFAQTMCILNTENCNIFVNLDRKDYQEVLDIMYEVILDTDIAIHLKKVKDLEKMAEDGVDKNNTKHRHLLLSLLMTSCDLNSSTKPWQDAQEAARKIYMEFFTQGDLEKVLDLQSQEMMDRNSACIPEQQISFTDFIAMPVFKILNKVFPETRNVLARLKANYDTWTKVKQMYWDQASVGSVSSRSSSASAKGSGSGLVSPRGMLGNSSEGEQSRSLRQQMGRFDSTTSISSASSSASCDSSVSACHRSASVGSMGRVSTGKKDPMSVSSSDSVPEEPTSPKKRASTGQLAVKKTPSPARV
eukprot:scpid21674/ scgid6186/ cGMP-dependent 3&apos; Cyclic GMP-stimulated phosphodiesterase